MVGPGTLARCVRTTLETEFLDMFKAPLCGGACCYSRALLDRSKQAPGVECSANAARERLLGWSWMGPELVTFQRAQSEKRGTQSQWKI